jgi:hypothetical protein
MKSYSLVLYTLYLTEVEVKCEGLSAGEEAPALLGSFPTRRECQH